MASRTSKTLWPNGRHRLAVPPSTIRAYLTHNIHYTLDEDCITAILHIRKLAADINAYFRRYPNLNMLG